MKIFIKYFIDLNQFNLIFSVLIGLLFFNIKYIPIFYGTIGTIVGYLSFNYFYKKEYYFYYNYGYSRNKLLFKTYKINIIIGISFFFIIKWMF